MKFDHHPTRNYFIVGNGKTVTRNYFIVGNGKTMTRNYFIVGNGKTVTRNYFIVGNGKTMTRNYFIVGNWKTMTRNYFIVGNVKKTMTIRDHGVFYENGASGENHRKPKRAIIKRTVKTASSGTKAATGCAYQHSPGPQQLLYWPNIIAFYMFNLLHLRYYGRLNTKCCNMLSLR